MRTTIIIDSNCDFSKQQAEELGFSYVPICVQFEGVEYLDGETLLPNEFYEKLEKSKEMPQTSLINEFRWEEAFEEATREGNEVVAITISSKLSGTYQAAVNAAKKFGDKVCVVDSLNATFGEGALGLYALRLRQEGLRAKEIAEKLNEKKKDICVYAGIDTLKYLKKGGRISAASALIGTTLSIKPIIALLDGEVKMIGKAMGSRKANAMLNSFIEKAGAIDFSMPLGYIWSGRDMENIQRYRKDSEYLLEGQSVPNYQIGSSIGTHIGSGAVGFVFFKK